MVVPNSHMSIVESQYAASAMKNIIKLWYNASSIVNQNECGL